MTNPSRLCPVCLEHGTSTKEDILPNWTRTLVLELYSEPGQWPARIVMPMCEACNGLSNKNLEIPARPIIEPILRGERTTLTPRQQVVASAWLAKGELLMFFRGQHAYPPHQNAEVVRHAAYDTIRLALPPSHTSIRIGRVDPTYTERGAGRAAGLLPGRFPDSLLWSFGTVGPLCVETIIGTQEELLPFIAETPSNERLTRLWPPSVLAAEWPPPVSLTFGDLDEARAAWSAAMGPSHQRSASYSTSTPPLTR